MSLLDRFRRKRPSKAAAPPNEPAEPPPLSLPAQGQIASFSQIDAVGTITLVDGQNLRFGRSACRDFEPVEGIHVLVAEVQPHPLGGLRAKTVELSTTGKGEYQRSIAARDQNAGINAPCTAEEMAATARGLGCITVLLREPLPSDPQQLRDLLRSLGFDALGVKVQTQPWVSFEVGRLGLQVYIGNEPYPREWMDLRFVGEAFDTGAAYIAISAGLPGTEILSRAFGGYPDPWAEDGRLRHLSRITERLLKLGTGVVLNMAGERVASSEMFLQHLGDLDDPACKPFAAWFDYAYTSDRTSMKTFGMEVFGLPNISVPMVSHDDDWEYERRLDALLYACHLMVRENRPLEEAELISVPVGVHVGAWPVTAGTGASLTYRAKLVDIGFSLEPQSALPSLGELWQITARVDAAPEERMSIEFYETLFVDSLAAELKFNSIAELRPDDIPEEVPPHVVHVMRPDGDEDGFLIATAGIGRVPQPGGDAESSSDHIELVAQVSQHGPNIALLLSYLSRLVHMHGDGDKRWAPQDKVQLPEPIFGLRCFLLTSLGTIQIAPGPAISLLNVYPLTDDEYASMNNDNVVDWFSRHKDNPAVRNRWLTALRPSR